MSYQREDIDKNNVKFTVAVDKAVINSNHEQALKMLGKDAKVAGFRKGHVPLEVLERSVDPARLGEMEINGSINQMVMQIIADENLQLLDQPKVSVVKYVPNDTLEFTVEMNIVPPVKLADPTKLKVKKPEVKVDKGQVDDVINRLRASSAERKTVERAAQNGDEVIIDFTGLQNDQEFPGGKAKDYQLELGSQQFIPGFEEGIVGRKAGDKFDVNVTFPKEYGAKNLAGKKAVFKIDLKKVNELTLPELNDEFAKTISPDLATMDALRKDIEGELQRTEEASAKEKYYGELLDKLAEKSKIDVPAVMIDNQVPQMRQQFEQNLMYRGLNLPDYLAQIGKDEKQWEVEDLRQSAEKQIRNALAMQQFIHDYNITVSDEDIDARQAEILSHYNNPKMQENFKTPEARRRMHEQLLTDRAHAKLAELSEGK